MLPGSVWLSAPCRPSTAESAEARSLLDAPGSKQHPYLMHNSKHSTYSSRMSLSQQHHKMLWVHHSWRSCSSSWTVSSGRSPTTDLQQMQ